MANLSWGGYRNGNIPQSALTKISNFEPLEGEPVGPSGAYLMNEAAHQWEIMCIDAKAATGLSPTASECYRDFASQIERKRIQLRDGSPLAAYPGYSNHGWGRSCDVGMLARSWIRANGHKYGWYFTVISEDWHADYLGNPIYKTAQSVINKPKEDEDEMSAYLYRNKDTGLVSMIDWSSGAVWGLPEREYLALVVKLKMVSSATVIEVPANEFQFILGRAAEIRASIADAVWARSIKGYNGDKTASERLVGIDEKADTLGDKAIAKMIDAIRSLLGK